MYKKDVWSHNGLIIGILRWQEARKIHSGFIENVTFLFLVAQD